MHSAAPLLAVLLKLTLAQTDAANCFVGQLNTFNATPGSSLYESTQPIIAASSLDNATKRALTEALSFEQSNYAGSSVAEDAFYDPPPFDPATSPPGTVLRIQQQVNTSLYTLPPTLALSRLLFTTETTNGTIVPASAYVLWPYQPRRFHHSHSKTQTNESSVPLLTFGHGTSGIAAESGPSHVRNLWYQYGGPFTAALAGYAVVGPDYAGLGVNHTADGAFIPHEYDVSPAAGNDLLYAARAAQAAFPRLSRTWAAFGHSQGGGAVWALSEMLAAHPERADGFVGAVAGSPSTKIAALITDDPKIIGGFVAPIAYGAAQIVPDFDIAAWLTPEGQEALDLHVALGGAGSVASVLFNRPNVVRADLGTNAKAIDQVYAFQNKTYNGGKPFKGPLLILQGVADLAVPAFATDRAVNDTCALKPVESLEYVRYPGVSHVPAMFAGQMDWLEFLRERFEGRSVKKGCATRTVESVLEAGAYQREYGYFLEWPRAVYEIS